MQDLLIPVSPPHLPKPNTTQLALPAGFHSSANTMLASGNTTRRSPYQTRSRTRSAVNNTEHRSTQTLTTDEKIPRGKRYRYWRHDLIGALPVGAGKEEEEEDRKSELVIAKDVTLDEFLKFRLNEGVIKRYHAHYRLIDGNVIVYEGISYG